MGGFSFKGVAVSALGLVLSAQLAAQPAVAADQALIDAAKKEGSVTWYTVQIVNQIVTPIATAFEKKYGIKVNYVRANSSEVVLRVVNEANAGHILCDVFDGSSTVPALKHRNLVLKWLPDSAKDYPSAELDPDGYWVALYLMVLTDAYNTDQVPAGTEPKSWNDFLDPKWTGKIAISGSIDTSGGAGLVGVVNRELGEEKGRAFLEKMAKQKLVEVPAANRQVLDQIVAGEYPIGLQISNHHVLLSQKQGAPVNWTPINPAMVSFVTASVAASAPHPNAGKLLLDFLASDEGQALYRDNGYPPANPKLQTMYKNLIPDGQKFRAQFFTPEQVDAGLPGWIKEYKELFD
ncbi:MAG TPA: extracellular solute-binding protein [Beijerinckiaceae bacterium]|nr:extracellular solute-binding protein [Beijerinckiaceae bacterium]